MFHIAGLFKFGFLDGPTIVSLFVVFWVFLFSFTCSVSLKLFINIRCGYAYEIYLADFGTQSEPLREKTFQRAFVCMVAFCLYGSVAFEL